MSIALIIPDRKLDDLMLRLQQALPETLIEIWPNLRQPDQVEFAVVWKQPAASLASLPALKAIQCFGAGVDAILADATLPALPIARIVDDHLTLTMVQYLHTVVQHYRLRLDIFAQQQQQSLWKPKSPRHLKQICVLGLGALGAAAAQHFVEQGFTVTGWSRTEKTIAGVSCFHGIGQLSDALAQADVVICLLPLTAHTEDLLDRDVFSQFKQGSIFINVARGAIVDDASLLDALDSGQLQAACLDVFRQEPLPLEHPFWRHQAIMLTPHISAVTNVATAVTQIAENYQRSQQGLAMRNLIDINRGY